MARIESILYPQTYEDRPCIKIGIGKHGDYDQDIVCLTLVTDSGEEHEVYLDKEDTEQLNLLILNWFSRKNEND